MTTNDPAWEIKEIRIYSGQLSPEEMTVTMKQLAERWNPPSGRPTWTLWVIAILIALLLAMILIHFTRKIRLPPEGMGYTNWKISRYLPDGSFDKTWYADTPWPRYHHGWPEIKYTFFGVPYFTTQIDKDGTCLLFELDEIKPLPPYWDDITSEELKDQVEMRVDILTWCLQSYHKTKAERVR